MDLVPKRKSNTSGNLISSANFIKSQGISLSGKGLDLAFLKNRRVFVSLAAVFLALLAFGALNGYGFYMDRKIDGLKEKTAALENDTELQVLSDGDIETVVKTLDKLNKDHIYSSAFFVLLEKLTLPEIRWQSVGLETIKGAAEMRGKSASYSFLAKQIINFEKEKIQISVSGISLDKDGVGFSAKLKFDPALLKNR